MRTLSTTGLAAALLLAGLPAVSGAQEEAPRVLDLGSRRELLVDHYLVESLKSAEIVMGSLRKAPASPEPGLEAGYTTVLADGDLFRMYGRGYLVPGAIWKTVGAEAGALNEITLYAVSRDGVRWTRPDLGLFKVDAVDERLLEYARKNNLKLQTDAGNIVMAGEYSVSHNFTPFIDTRPGVSPDERYKALGGNAYSKDLRKKHGPAGVHAFVSADGLRWKRLRNDPILPEAWGKFDSQNLAFWSELEKQYVAYFRYFKDGKRAIRRSTSQDFLTWTDPVAVEANLPGEQLYTSNVHPYFRAPHLYIAPATRYVDGQRPNTFVVLMTSRDGVRFDRTFGQKEFKETIGGDRTNYLAWTNGVQTGPGELSYYDHRGNRYLLRLDGFGSLHAGKDGGELLTKRLTFSGRQLEINAKTAPGGSLRVEILDGEGKPVAEAGEFTGDEVDYALSWKSVEDLSSLAGKPVRLRVSLRDAELYAFRFR